MSITSGLTQLQSRAKRESHEICQTGKSIVLSKAATKDELGEILTWSTLTFKSHPIRFSPYSRKTVSKVAWAENVNVICTISMQSIETLSLTIDDLKSYSELTIDGKKFKITKIEEAGSFGANWLLVNIGGIYAS